MPIPRYPLLPNPIPSLSPPYSSANIDTLYSLFSCCFADYMYKKAKGRVTGNSDCGCPDYCENYLVMGLNILQQAITQVSLTFTIPAAFLLTPLGNPIYCFFTSQYGVGDETYELFDAFNVGTYIGLYNQIVAQLPAGCTISSSSVLPTVTIYFPQTYTFPYPLGWFYFNFNNGPSQYQFWEAAAPLQINSYTCLSAQQIENVIEGMLKCCGCINCTNYNSVTKDNVWVSIGQINSYPPDNVQTNIPLISQQY